MESGLGFQHCCITCRLWWRELPAVVWALPWKNPPSRVSPECPRVWFDMQAPLLQRKPRSPSVRGRALTKKNPRRAACVETSRAVERNCSPRYNDQLAVQRRWFTMRILGNLCWLFAKLLDFCALLYDKRHHKSCIRLKIRLTCSYCEDSQQEHHLLSLFLVGQLLLCTFGAGHAEFPDGCHSDKLPASLSHGEQQSCTASSQWATYFGQVSRNDRSVDGMILKEWLDYGWVGSLLNRKISVIRFSMLLLMTQVPTLGSQEGAFENVRMNYSGDQGQTIRQLISAHVLRRVAMCVLSSPHGRRQHLAVSHEKGKVSSLTL